MFLNMFILCPLSFLWQGLTDSLCDSCELSGVFRNKNEAGIVKHIRKSSRRHHFEIIKFKSCNDRKSQQLLTFLDRVGQQKREHVLKFKEIKYLIFYIDMIFVTAVNYVLSKKSSFFDSTGW